MRISDWSSDVCSSDLRHPRKHREIADHRDRARDGRGDGHDKRVAVLHMAKLMRHHTGQFVAVQNLEQAGGRGDGCMFRIAAGGRSEEHTSELQSLMRISYAVFCLKKNKYKIKHGS